MAEVKRRRRRKKSISGYFRNIFDTEPGSFKKSNQDLLDRWAKDHPRHTEKMLKKVRANLANLRSTMRKQERESGRGKTSPRAGAVRTGLFALGGKPTMEALEEQLDECLTMAKILDPDGLESVIKRLHLARNEVVWKLTP